MCVCGEGELRQERVFRFIPSQQRMLCSQWKSLSEVYGFLKGKGKKKKRKKERAGIKACRKILLKKKKFCIEFVAILLQLHAFISWLKAMHAGSQLPNHRPNPQSPNHWITREVLRVLLGGWEDEG